MNPVYPMVLYYNADDRDVGHSKQTWLAHHAGPHVPEKGSMCVMPRIRGMVEGVITSFGPRLDLEEALFGGDGESTAPDRLWVHVFIRPMSDNGD